MRVAGPKAGCLCPGCERSTVARGLCARHYEMARLLVSSGKTTWEKLESASRCLVRHKQGADARRWFLGTETRKEDEER